MSVKVKICGLKTASAVAAAVSAGADYIGLVFFPPSPRNVSLEEGQILARQARGAAKVVALSVDADDALLAKIAAVVEPDLFQLHGSEPPQRVAQIKQRFGVPVMKAIKIETRDDAARALGYRGIADIILFDAKPPEGSMLPGGNGVAFDWALLDGVKEKVTFMLSGGLTPANVADAIRATNPLAVDVSSGVETAPGVKSTELIAEFMRAAKSA